MKTPALVAVMLAIVCTALAQDEKEKTDQQEDKTVKAVPRSGFTRTSISTPTTR